MEKCPSSIVSQLIFGFSAIDLHLFLILGELREFKYGNWAAQVPVWDYGIINYLGFPEIATLKVNCIAKTC